MLPLYLALLAIAYQAAPAAPPSSDDIIIRGKRLSDAQWECREGSDKLFTGCKLRRTTGDKEVDAVLTAAMRDCIAQHVPSDQMVDCLRKHIEPYVGRPVTGELN